MTTDENAKLRAENAKLQAESEKLKTENEQKKTEIKVLTQLLQVKPKKNIFLLIVLRTMTIFSDFIQGCKNTKHLKHSLMPLCLRPRALFIMAVIQMQTGWFQGRLRNVAQKGLCHWNRSSSLCWQGFDLDFLK